MNPEQTMSVILPRVKASVSHLQRLVAEFPPAATTRPLLGGERSVKDMLAHLAWWDQWLLTTLPPAPGAEALSIDLPLREQIPDGDTWAEEMNAKVLQHNKSRKYQEVWEDFEKTGGQLIARVSVLTDADLNDPQGLSAAIGHPLMPLIVGIYEHYEEHAHELEQIAL